MLYVFIVVEWEMGLKELVDLVAEMKQDGRVKYVCILYAQLFLSNAMHISLNIAIEISSLECLS